jgi:hypothetical protein
MAADAEHALKGEPVSLLISIVVGLIIVGFALWLVKCLPLDPPIKTIITGVVIFAVVLWIIDVLLTFFGYGGLGPAAGCGRHVGR